MLLLLSFACAPKATTDAETDTGAETGAETSGETGVDCQVPGAIELASTAVEAWHWEGEANPSWELTYAVVSPACEGFLFETDATWLVAAPNEGDGVLRLAADASALPSGTHEAVVTIRDGSGGVAATLSVTVRALHEPSGDAVRHALVIGVDGLDGEELARINTPTLDLLRRHGLSTNGATTQLTGDTVSGPGWTSVFTGVEVEDHGVTANGDYDARNPDYPSFISRLANAGVRAGVAFQWPDLFAIVEADSYEEAVAGDMAAVSEGMERLLAEESYELYVVHLDDVDHAGHASGFSADNEDYVAAVAEVERSIASFLAALTSRPDIAEEDWLVVLTADHGGAGNSHGDRTADCQTIPLIISGAGVPAGQIGTGSHLDVHPTLLRHFGLDPRAWDLDGIVRLEPLEDLCDDGVDGDGDGAVDCDDTECVDAAECRACEPEPLGSAVGASVWSGNLSTEEWEGSCDGSGGAEQLFTYTASLSGAWVFSAEGSGIDSSLYVLDGGCDGAELACADDVAGLGGGRAAVSTTLVAGQEVTVILDSSSGVGAEAGLAVLSPPTSCPDATLDAGATSTSGSLPEPTTGVLDGCATAFGPVLYAWTATATGTWTFDTLGSSGDTVVYVLDGCGGASLGCNDDASDLQSIVEVALVEGQTVVVAVGSFAATTSSYTLNVTGPG